jgi:hypothetical protein
MADNPLTITSPLDGSTIKVPKGKFTLSVTGDDAVDNNKITSAVLSLNGVDTGIPAKMPIQPAHWLVTFLIDKASVGPKDVYSVKVTDTGGHQRESTFHMQEAKITAVGRDVVTPGSGSTVAGSGFTVSYPYQPHLAVSAFIGGPMGWRKSGIQIQQQPDEVFYFQSVLPGTGYTITVTVYDNPLQYSYSNNITVT